MTVRQAIQEYFAANGFADDGGYDDKYVALKIWLFTFKFPNSQARRRAVVRHDIHHVVTGYTTDILGEAEIGAWELASGCSDYYAAWILNGMAMGIGVFISPRRIYRAFQLGRNSQNLYTKGESVLPDSIYDMPVAELKAKLLPSGFK